jgi:group I intron endonuclease
VIVVKNILDSGGLSVACIYCIENKLNNKKYIGKTVKDNHNIRWHEHKLRLKRNIHSNSYLQNSWNKDGEENFAFWIIETCQKEQLFEREIYWINSFNTFINGYNLTKGGEGNLGMKRHHSKETKIKMSESHKGMIFSEEHKKKISEVQKGKIISEETRKKLSDIMKGKKGNHTGIKHSEESKRKMSSAKKGKGLTEEHKSNISKAMKGRCFSEETKIKISENQKGKHHPHKGTPHTEEAKRKISLARKEYSKKQKEI